MNYTLADIKKLQTRVDCKISQVVGDYLNRLMYKINCKNCALDDIKLYTFYRNQLQEIIDYNTNNTLYDSTIPIYSTTYTDSYSLIGNVYTIVINQKNGWFLYRDEYFDHTNTFVKNVDYWKEFIVIMPQYIYINLDTLNNLI